MHVVEVGDREPLAIGTPDFEYPFGDQGRRAPVVDDHLLAAFLARQAAPPRSCGEVALCDKMASVSTSLPAWMEARNGTRLDPGFRFLLGRTLARSTVPSVCGRPGRCPTT